MIEQRGFSQRRACRLLGIDHSTLRYRSKRPDDAALPERLRKLAQERRSLRLSQIGLVREKHSMNQKKLYRLYQEEKLMVRRRGRAKARTGDARADETAARDQSTLITGLRVPMRSLTGAVSRSFVSWATLATRAWPPWSTPRSAESHRLPRLTTPHGKAINMKGFISLVALLIVMLAGSAQAVTTVYVNNTASCPGSGTSAVPYCTIQNAFDVVRPGN